jgi:hypothetical protein
MIDADLAELYDVPIKRLNQQVFRLPANVKYHGARPWHRQVV